MAHAITVDGSRRPSRLWSLLFAVWGTLLVFSGTALAADDEPAENEEDEIPLNRGNWALARQFEITPETVETWVFHTSGRSGRRQMEDGLTNSLTTIERLVPISPAQRTKMELAGRGDIAIFFQQVDELKRSAPRGVVSIDLIRDLQRQASRLQTQLTAGVHGPDSLFQKTVRTALDRTQIEQIQARQQERLAAHHEARIDEIIARFARHADLTDEQRVAIRTLLSTRTVPPGQVGTILVRFDQGPFVRSVARIPSDEFLKIVDEKDRPKIGRLVDVYKLQAAAFQEN